MSLDAKIKRLLEQGDYLEADRLADEHKITDCRNICQNLDEINEIANTIEHSISLISSLDEKINGYQSELRNFEDTAFQMEREDDAVKIQGENIRATCALIETLMGNLSISDQTREVLLVDNGEGNLYDEHHAELVEASLKQLEVALKFKPDHSLRDIKCVREQKELAESVKSKFCHRFYDFFAQFIDQLFSEYSESFINHIYSQAITMPGHDVIHNHLLYLAQIVRWIWDNDKSTYEALNNFYNAKSKAQYDKELKIFFECAKEKMANPSRNHGRLAELSADARKRTSMGASESNTRASSLSGNTLDTQDTVSGKSSEISYTGWDEFDAYIERILHAIDPTCSSEQRFYLAFFPGAQDGGGEPTNTKQLVAMFNLLENLFNNFADYYNNGLYSLYLLVRLSQYFWEQNNSHLFLMQIYREVLIRVKRNFDTFMKLQLDSIREMKAPKQSKCGVLSVVKNFEQFAKQVETLFKSTGARRSDIDRWYIELVTELFKAIDRVEHNRTPTEMIRLENYNYLHDVLRSIKVPCLKAKQEEAHLQYKIALDSYVARYFGRPLEKINIFFEGVQAKVAQGVKEEEISFQLAFSKQELRKVLQMVTLKEVRRGLEEMYRRIEKHASEPDSNLIQVIWHAMQTEFVSQYEAIQGLIERCYPSTNSSLTFTIDDVLRVFSDIAQSH